MIFALIDYINYKHQKGRFSLKHGSDIMCGAFCGTIPDVLVETLEPGDPIFVGNFNWWLSWLIMFLTSSQVSHIVLYAGNHKVFHQTLAGPALEPIEHLYSPYSRLLPFKLPELRGKRQKPLTEEVVLAYRHIPYPTKQVLKKALNIITGRDWKYFRFKFATDALLVLLLATSPFSIMRIPIFPVMSCMYIALLFFNRLLSCFHPLPADSSHGKPCDGLWQFRMLGGVPLFNPESAWLKRCIRKAAQINATDCDS